MKNTINPSIVPYHIETNLIKKEYKIAFSIDKPKFKRILDVVNSVVAMPPGINVIKPTRVEAVWVKQALTIDKSYSFKLYNNL